MTPLKTICCLFLASLFYVACNDAATTVKSNGAESTQRDTNAAGHEVEGYDEAEGLKNFIREMSLVCDNPITKDTLFIFGNDSISMTFHHGCNGDSFLLPEKYLEPVKLDRFMAHSLKSNIVVKKNGVTILDRQIVKQDFDSLTDESLKQYAVLFLNSIGRENDTVYIDYSISVPITDVGMGVRASIHKDGSIQFGHN